VVSYLAKFVIFTDLDGTLLDANTYSPDAAKIALARVQALGWPIIFCSAKTAAEQAPIRAALNVTDTYIVENGSAIYFQDEEPLVLGLRAAEIHARLARIRTSLGLAFRGFHEASTAEVAAVTGLSLAAARLAQQREFSATIFTPFTPEDLARFIDACAAEGLRAPSGGRFYTVTGQGADKGVAVRQVMRRYSGYISVGIGDSPNDAPLLRAVQRPYLVQRPDGTWHDLDVPHMVRVSAIGPIGWSQVITELLAEHA